MPNIEDLRGVIDGIDDQLLDLLNRRAKLVIEIGRIKKQENSVIHVPNRERQIVSRLSENNPGPFPNEAVRAVFREVFSASLALEQPIRIAYMGPSGTFSHLACIQQFGYSPRHVPVNSIKDVFSEVERGLAEYGVVPVENSTEGIINSTHDMFMESDLKIYGEVLLEVSLNLMNKSGKMEDVKKVYSHPQPLAQCRGWIEANLRGIPVAEAPSTTRAAETAAEDESCAAIASRLAAEIYGLKVIKERIEDNINNVTRFFIISKKYPSKTGQDKTSILFSIKDKAGALYEMLKPFAAHGINLTKIESRPSRKKAWEYHFFVDMEGHIEDAPVRDAIEALRKDCLFLKVLGAYPAGELPAGNAGGGR